MRIKFLVIIVVFFIALVGVVVIFRDMFSNVNDLRAWELVGLILFLTVMGLGVLFVEVERRRLEESLHTNFSKKYPGGDRGIKLAIVALNSHFDINPVGLEHELRQIIMKRSGHRGKSENFFSD